jgi:hypothetical protein
MHVRFIINNVTTIEYKEKIHQQQINLYDNGQLIDSVTVVVMGDVDGTGIMDTTDYLRIRSVFLGTYSLTDVENLAADMDANGIIDSTDYLKIKAKFLDI